MSDETNKEKSETQMGMEILERLGQVHNLLMPRMAVILEALNGMSDLDEVMMELMKNYSHLTKPPEMAQKDFDLALLSNEMLGILLLAYRAMTVSDGTLGPVLRQILGRAASGTHTLITASSPEELVAKTKVLDAEQKARAGKRMVH